MPELLDNDWLRRRYVADEATVRDLADEAHVTPMTIYRWLRKAGIPLRPRGGGLSGEWLRAQVDAGASVTAIARRAGVARSAVLDRLSTHERLGLTGRARV